MIRQILLISLVLLLAAIAGQAQPPRGLQLADLVRLKDVSDAQISPDGNQIVFTVGTVKEDLSGSQTRLWIVPTQGGEVRRLTVGEANETNPRWSPDGKWIAFLSDRNQQNGLWIVAAAGGEPRFLSRILRSNFYLTHAGENITWSPDSKQLAFLASPEILTAPIQKETGREVSNALPPQVVPDQLRRPLTREEINQLPEEVRKLILSATGQASPATNSEEQLVTNFLSNLPEDPRVITRQQYKSRTAFSDTRQSHIFIIDITSNQLQQLTFGPYYEHSINWSPKGEEIVFVSNHEPDPDRVNNTDIFTVNIRTKQTRQLTNTKGCEWTPLFAPNGQEIAFTGTQRPVTTIDSVAEDTHLFLIPAQTEKGQGSALQELNKEQDRRVFSLRWSPDGQLIYFTANDHGKTMLYQATRLGSVRPLLEYEAQITNFSIARSGSLAMCISDATHPTEIYATRSPGKFEPVTKLNQSWLGTFQPVTPRQFSFKNENLDIEGWLLPPVGFRETGKYPLVLLIHGGPHGMHGYAFNTNAQTLAARGYAVLLINPRGSSGYGQRFADGCLNDWGGGDYRDLMKGVDEALARFSFLDKDRLGVSGASYGGYMTNWIVTQADRFKAAVPVASLSNLISFYSTSLYQDLIHAEFNGYPWNNYELLWERSPLKHIKNVKTPTLLMHGEQDNDVHITQAEEFFTALKVREIEAAFIRYPREGHSISEPRHRLDLLARTILWFDRYLQPRADSK